MIITYGGLETFRVQFGDTVLAFNPASKGSKHRTPSFGSDIAFISADHEDFNGIDSVSRGEKEPFVVGGPGEYEIGGVFIKGVPSSTEYGQVNQINTIYVVNLENMNLCYLGALGSTELPNGTRSELPDIDILFVPIGGQGVLNAAEAYKFATSLEPSIIIPMHYGEVGDKDALKIFLKEGGAEGQKPIDKLTVKKKDLEGKEGEIVVLSAG